MTEAKASTVAAALITAGYQITTSIGGDGQWHVQAQGAAIDPNNVHTFAVNNGVTATVTQADFV